jgi:crotonobetainyl-CoA:carnitine CoA-transferase CaiB-like acyl-CoA transferase
VSLRPSLDDGVRPGALAGVRVLEFAQAMAVPACGALLADMGADVIKIEPPEGDAFRHTQQPIVPGESKGYTVLNRGKRSICLDVGNPEATPLIAKLVARADVVLISLKPSDLPRYGLDYERLAGYRPGLIYLENVPLGPDGPFGQYGGYDVVVQGMSGSGAITARSNGDAPHNIRPAYIDMGTGFLSALGVVAALRHRDLTGEGQRVQTSLLSTGITLANQLVSWFAATDPPLEAAFDADLAEAQSRGAGYEEQRALYEKHFLRGAYGNIYFRHYRTRDGFISVGCLSPSLNARFRAVTGVYDPRYEPGFDLASPEAHVRLTGMVAEAEATLAGRTTKEWISAFTEGGVPCGPFNFPPQVFSDEQVLANEFVIELDHPILGPYKTFAPPIRMAATPTRVRSAAPALDADTDAVLAELGLLPEEVVALRSKGIVGGAS